MGQLRTSLGMGKARWNALRTAIHFALAAARLDPTENWKAQEKDRIMAACNVVKEDYPKMGRFVGDWGFDHIAQDAFSGGKSYCKCVTNPETYRGRITAARPGARRQQQRSPARFPPPRSTPASPIAGPSCVGASDNDNDNDLMSFNNDPGERDQCQKLAGKKRVAEDDKEENPGASKRRRHKKRRSKSQGIDPAKRSTHRVEPSEKSLRKSLILGDLPRLLEQISCQNPAKRLWFFPGVLRPQCELSSGIETGGLEGFLVQIVGARGVENRGRFTATSASTEDPMATGQLGWMDSLSGSSSTIEGNGVATPMGGEDGSVESNNGGG
ncbi:hypothetical protein B0H14DRAFT_2644626 [Mycena olivaceomarginata]|nr:hypothetical protein B0H14DRAFT_2644626 [Mycena olivaceomarginata]